MQKLCSKIRIGAVLPWLTLAACWPVGGWLARRVAADPTEGVGLAAVVVALVLLRGARDGAVRWPWLLPGLLLLGYAAGYAALPPLARGVLAVTALAAALSATRLGTRLHLPLWGLLLLALPVIPSLQFFAGYPLRVAVAQVAAPLLRGGGFLVQPQGACLRWGAQLIAIDAPCSGVKMLWAGALLIAVLAWWLRLSPWRTLLAAAGGVVIIVLGNALRTAALFYPEAGIITVPGWLHGAVGLLVFLGVAVGLAAWVRWLAGTGADEAQQPRAPEVLPPRPWPTLLFLLVALLAACAPWWGGGATASAAADFPGWPTTIEGQRLHACPLSARERQFAEDFPGRVGRFSDGRRDYVLRWVTRDTRLLHPAADCYRALGYRITPQPLARDAQGRCWGAFTATRAGHAVRVREIITDDAGHSWSDVSAWYWSAALHRTPGPWWAITVVE